MVDPVRALIQAAEIGSKSDDSSVARSRFYSSSAEKLATRLTLSLPLHELLRSHPRFAEAYVALPRDEQEAIRNAWSQPPEGLYNMVRDCWLQDLFDWEVMATRVGATPAPAPTTTEKSPRSMSMSMPGDVSPRSSMYASRKKRSTSAATCLSYSSEQYGVWARLLDKAVPALSDIYVSVRDLVRFTVDDRTHIPRSGSPRGVRSPSQASPLQSPSPTLPSQQGSPAGSPVGSPAGSPVASQGRESVRVEGTPAVGEVLAAVHGLDDTAVCNWSVAEDGWCFSFLRSGEQLRLGADEVHKYVQVDVTTRDECVTSRVVFVNVSEEADRAMAELVANCITADAPAEFAVLADGATAALYLNLAPKGGSRLELVEGDDITRLDTHLGKCEWQCSSATSIALTPPNLPSVVLECESMSERDTLVLCMRLFASFPPPLAVHLASSGLNARTLAAHLLRRPDTLVYAAGSIPTLLMRAENGALSPL